MFFHRCLLAGLWVFPFTLAETSQGVYFDWMASPPGSPGHICSSQSGWESQSGAAGICRSFGRFNMLVVPPSGDITAPMLGSLEFSLDGGVYVPGGVLVYERHMLQSDGDTSISNLPNGTQSQMWAWGYDTLSNSVEKLPKSICVKVWFREASTGQALPTTPPVLCQNFTTTYETNFTFSDIKTTMPSAVASVMCGKSSPVPGKPCRLNAHMPIFTTTGASALHTVIGWAEWSIDNSSFAAGGETYYIKEMQAREDGETWPQWQAMEADLDLWVPADPLPKVICVRPTVQNTVTMVTQVVNTSLVGPGGCLKVCTSLANFHKPYCPDDNEFAAITDLKMV